VPVVWRSVSASHALPCSVARKEYKEKREDERAERCEKARRVKEVYARGGEKALMKYKWPCFTQN
jgi:hypothetical protein